MLSRCLHACVLPQQPAHPRHIFIPPTPPPTQTPQPTHTHPLQYEKERKAGLELLMRRSAEAAAEEDVILKQASDRGVPVSLVGH